MDTKRLVTWGGIALLAFIAILLVVRPTDEGGVTNVSPTQVEGLAADGVRIVDVRSSGEYETGHVPGAENVPMDRFAEEASGWDRTEPLLVYCAVGARSTQAVQYLDSLGFEVIYHLSDGISAWTDDLERPGAVAAQEPPDVRPTEIPVMYEFFTGW